MGLGDFGTMRRWDFETMGRGEWIPVPELVEGSKGRRDKKKDFISEIPQFVRSIKSDLLKIRCLSNQVNPDDDGVVILCQSDEEILIVE